MPIATFHSILAPALTLYGEPAHAESWTDVPFWLEQVP
jgi:hypothetical protein